MNRVSVCSTIVQYPFIIPAPIWDINASYFISPTLQAVTIQSSPLHYQKTALNVYQKLLKYSLSWDELYLNGYPTQDSDCGSVYIYVTNFFKNNVKVFIDSKITQKEQEVLQEKTMNAFRKRFETDISKEFIREGYVIRKCVRCREFFAMTHMNEYLTTTACSYHSGRIDYSGYSCCSGSLDPVGCEKATCHVWSGLNDGLNGPMKGYVKTKPKVPSIRKDQYGIYGLDCEMGFTSEGMELVKVAVINQNGDSVYETIVQPNGFIIDLNSRYSGVTTNDYRSGKVKSLKEVQNDLTRIIGSESLLVGHSLEGDLKALKMVHERVIDTSILFAHEKGLPYRYSLKVLAKRVLKRNIQTSKYGHDSLEDARAALDLALWKVHNHGKTY